MREQSGPAGWIRFRKHLGKYLSFDVCADSADVILNCWDMIQILRFMIQMIRRR